jgi:hypothetical protein
MAIVVFWSISVLYILCFSVTRRSIHLFEGIVIWSFLIHTQYIFVGLCFNYNLVQFPPKLDEFLAYYSIRGVIIPLSIILFLELNGSVNGIWKKSFCWVGIILLLFGIEYFAELLKAIGHSEKWKLWWTFSFYTTLVLLTFMVFKWVRRIARREVII